MNFSSILKSQKVNYQKLKENYLLKSHQSQYLKSLGEFNFTPPSREALAEQIFLTAAAKNENQTKKEMMLELKSSLEMSCDAIVADHEKMIRERDDMIECLAKCRELDEEYEQIFLASQQLDQTAVLFELEKEKAEEEKEIEKLTVELKEVQDALGISLSRLNSVSQKLPALEAKMIEAEEREKEAIKISNEKDPRVEELGKWYKETISLLSKMHDISDFTLCSDTKFQITYFGGEYIINYTLNPEGTIGRLVDIEMLKGVLVIYDIIETSSEFATMNQALTYIVTQIYLRLQAKKARMIEFEPLIQKGIASFEEGSNELLIQSETSARCFLIRLGPLYPIGGLRGAKMVLIEVLEEGEDLKEWEQKMMNFATISELIPSLV